MTSKLNETRLSFPAERQWEAHGCLFYDTPDDLLKALAAFFQQGLSRSEACLWIASSALTNEQAADRLRESIPLIDQYFAKGAIHVIPHTSWHLKNGSFDVTLLSERFEQAIRRAAAGGYKRLRLTGDAAWLPAASRKIAPRYEKQLGARIENLAVTMLCTYPLAGADAYDLLEVAQVHERTLISRGGLISLLEAPGPNRAKEQREMRRQQELLQRTLDHSPVMISLAGSDGRLQWINREWTRTLGWNQEEILRPHFDVLTQCYPDPDSRRSVIEFMAASEAKWREFKTRTKDGRMLDTLWARVRLSDGGTIGFGQDVTERRQVEELLRTNNVRLRALSANIQAAREEERTHVARTVHDELGAALTSLKWDLESLLMSLAEPLGNSQREALRSKIPHMTELADRTMEAVRRIASELRPSILDDLGLVQAIRWQAQQFENRTGIHCRVVESIQESAFSAEQSIGLFRILQEALTNILRHARATQVEIGLERTADGFLMTIRDNGRGISAVEKSGLGILGMQERARLLEGTLEVTGTDRIGTQINVRIPQQ